MSPYRIFVRTLCVGFLFAEAGAALAQSAPLTLEAALERAEAAAPTLSQAKAGVAAAAGRRQQAGVLPNPEARLGVENAGGSGAYNSFTQAETTLSLAQTVELGGKREARIRAGDADVAAATLSASVVRADLAAAVKSRFATALAAGAQVDLARSALQRAINLERSAQTLVDAGREPPLRALRAGAAKAEAQAELDRTIAADNAARAAIAALLGDTVAPQSLSGSLASQARPTGSADPTQSLEVRLAEAQVAAAEAIAARERAARAVDVTAELGVRRFELSNDTAVVFGLSAPIPVFNRNQGNIAAAYAEANAAKARRLQALADAVQKTRNAEDAYRAADSRVQTLETVGGPAAQQALGLARAGFEAGRFSLLDVLDAEAAFATSQSALIEAQRDRAIAAAELERALAR